MKKTLLCLLACLCLISTAALADSVSMTGTVVPGASVEVYAPIGGTVLSVPVKTGQTVKAGDVLFTLKTNPVYAEQDGTVTGVFGVPGDSAETVASRYGAVLYIESDRTYTVSASTSSAYNTVETRLVHIGETVYLQCRSSTSRTGEGIITSAEGNSFQIEVRSGSFIPGDSVDIFRNSAFTSSSRIGRGSVSRVNPIAVTGTGAIVRIAVKDGDPVKRGDLLLETLNGTFDGLVMTGTDITAPADGVLGEVNVTAGYDVAKNSLSAVIYPLSGMQAEASVPEDSRNLLHTGDPVTIELSADESVTCPGTIALISSVAEGTDGEVTYRVLADFTPTESVRFGMSVIVSTPEDGQKTGRP